MRNFIRGAFVFLISLFLLILLITGGNMLIFWNIFNWIQGSIHVITGLDTQFSKVFAALALAVIVMLPFGRIILAFTPLPQKRKNIYRTLVFLGIALFFSLTYWAARNTYFDPDTGRPVKYYSLLPNGEYRFYTEPGYDPLTGDALKEVTSEVSMKSSGLWKENETPFNPETGEPMQYYSQLPNGEYRFYPESGFDPLTGEPLRKVDREVSLKSRGLLSTPDYHFDPETGEPLKYYSQLPDGRYRIYSEPGYDPVTGDFLMKITREVSLKSRGLWKEPEVPVKEPPKQMTSGMNNHRPEQREKSKEKSGLKETESNVLLKPFQTTPVLSGSRDKREYPPPVVARGKINLRNETNHLIRIYDSNGELVKLVKPRSKMSLQLPEGEYYHTEGKHQKYFTVEGGKSYNLRVFGNRTANDRLRLPPVRQNNSPRNRY